MFFFHDEQSQIADLVLNIHLQSYAHYFITALAIMKYHIIVIFDHE